MFEFDCKNFFLFFLFFFFVSSYKFIIINIIKIRIEYFAYIYINRYIKMFNRRQIKIFFFLKRNYDKF